MEQIYEVSEEFFRAHGLVSTSEEARKVTYTLTGAVDAISDVDLKTVSLLARAPGVEIDNVPSGAHVTLPMFCDVEPFKDNNVRMALKLAMDREAIVEKILYGYGAIGNDTPIGPSLPYYADLPQRKYDPEKAKHHLKKAGMENLKIQFPIMMT